jgi:5-methylcytosine-specific restriction endonuclease McrA
VNRAVLLLNQNYEPLNVCRARRAIVLLMKGKAEMLAHLPEAVRTQRLAIPRPTVIRMLYQVRRPWPQVKLSRREIFVRDRFTCQYCGASAIELTVDHVVPRHLGGTRRWENLVTACRFCNLRKANRTPRQANMRLLTQPARPRSAFRHLVWQLAAGRAHPSWAPFLPEPALARR